MHDVFIGIGSNIDPAANLRVALDALGERFDLALLSSVYRSPAHGFTGDDFLNMVVGFRSKASPEIVEQDLYRIEYSGGRQRRARELSSRTLDLDLLLYGMLVDPTLKLPRDDTLQYPFVLAPFAEIAPEVVHPLSGSTMRAAWEEMSATNVSLTKLGGVGCLGSLLATDLLPTDASAAVDG